MKRTAIVVFICVAGCGTQGDPGQPGAMGLPGAMGEPGTSGIGSAGAMGMAGQSVTVVAEAAGANCAHGGVALTSVSGTSYVCNGAPAVSAYGYFYALMPNDNPATVGAGAAVQFPRTGPASGVDRATASTFTLPAIGVYDVSWQVSVNEPGQLVLALDAGAGAVELPSTVVGRATGTTQLVGHALITTTVVNSSLSVRNPIGNSPALTITPLAGGTDAVTAGLVIKRIS